MSHSLEEQAKLNHDKSVLATTVKKLNRDVEKVRFPSFIQNNEVILSETAD
jgi:hypothetical protein